MSSASVVTRGKKYELDPVGITVHKQLSFADWAGMGTWLEQIEKGIQWWIGDWMVYGEERFGEEAAQAVDATGWSIATLSQYRWVCQSVPRRNRRADLSFFHHREVAHLPPPEQKAWLAKAAQGDDDGVPWTTERLKVEVRAAKTGVSPDLYVVVAAKDHADATALLERMRGEGRTAKLQEKKAKKA